MKAEYSEAERRQYEESVERMAIAAMQALVTAKPMARPDAIAAQALNIALALSNEFGRWHDHLGALAEAKITVDEHVRRSKERERGFAAGVVLRVVEAAHAPLVKSRLHALCEPLSPADVDAAHAVLVEDGAFGPDYPGLSAM
jgi:hypothetical protein